MTHSFEIIIATEHERIQMNKKTLVLKVRAMSVLGNEI